VRCWVADGLEVIGAFALCKQSVKIECNTCHALVQQKVVLDVFRNLGSLGTGECSPSVRGRG